MNDIPYILSLAYKKQIEPVCNYIKTIGLNYFVMYLVLNDGNLFILSNVYPILKPYYQEALYKQDYTYTAPVIASATEGYYLCTNIDSVTPDFKKILAEKYSIFPIYNIVRSCVECTFIFSAICNTPVDLPLLFYKKTIASFENFCTNFVDSFLNLITMYNPNYKYAFILSNKAFRHAIIKGGYADNKTLSFREQECLWLASQGKSGKQIAQVLKISPFTVEKHLKKIRETFNCSSLTEAVVEGIHRGVIGKINIPVKLSNQHNKSNAYFARPILR